MAEFALTARCPAKINWTLRVLGRRSDGYHELETVFQAIDVWDTLEVRGNEGLQLRCDDPSVPTGADNLVLRAAAAVREASGTPSCGAEFRLRKTIPVGGGLGGGSSDAAGAILLLDRLWDLGLDREQMVKVAATIGADVPFFLFGGTAVGTGRGDELHSATSRSDVLVLLGFPPFSIPTAEVFRRLPDRLTHLLNDVSLSRLQTRRRPEIQHHAGLFNDLEAIAFEGWPGLKIVRDALLERGALCALLSGSGSTVFGVFESRERMDQAIADLEFRFDAWRFVPTRTISDGVRIERPS